MAGPAPHESRAPAAPHPVRRRHWLCGSCANEHILARGARQCHLVRVSPTLLVFARLQTLTCIQLSHSPLRVSTSLQTVPREGHQAGRGFLYVSMRRVRYANERPTLAGVACLRTPRRLIPGLRVLDCPHATLRAANSTRANTTRVEFGGERPGILRSCSCLLLSNHTNTLYPARFLLPRQPRQP